MKMHFKEKKKRMVLYHKLDKQKLKCLRNQIKFTQKDYLNKLNQLLQIFSFKKQRG